MPTCECQRTTIAAFDRFETTLSIDKGLDILRVVGLADADGGAASSDRTQFERDALERWQKLTQKLPEGDPVSFPDRRCLFSYELIGETRRETAQHAAEMARAAPRCSVGERLAAVQHL
jgi:hypothetical protein